MARDDTPEILLSRLEKLVRVLIELRFESAAKLWKLEMDLLALQRDIQSAVAEAKRDARKSKAVLQQLQSLRLVRWHARRFGDALAWVFFRANRQMIYPLAQNARVPILPEDHGSRGVQAMSTVLSERGWGFPLLHDITDCLRIGDVTFFNAGDHRPRTVEIKTKLVSETPHDDGPGATVEYSVAVVFSDDGSTPPDLGTSTKAEPVIRTPSILDTPRARRQLRRMDTALAAQTAPPQDIRQVGDIHHITMTLPSEAGSHWDVLRRVLRKARRNGYAAEAVEGTFVYAAIYDDRDLGDGRANEHFKSLAADLVASGVFPPEGRDQNALVFFSVPEERGGAQLFMPYFLYPIPRTSILDILHGRMIIFVFANPAQITKALEAAGFGVSVPSGRPDLSNASFVIETSFDLDGVPHRAELRNLSVHVSEMIMEFRSVSFIVSVAKTMRDALLLDATQDVVLRAQSGDESGRD